MRIFIGYFLPESSKKQLVELQKQLEYTETVKTVTEKNFHATVIYNGEVTVKQYEQYYAALQQIKWEEVPLITITGIKSFVKKNKVIVVAELENTDKIKANRQKAQEIANQFAIPVADQRAYIPHITLARQKNSVVEKEFHEKIEISTKGLMIFISRQGVNGITYDVIAEL